MTHQVTRLELEGDGGVVLVADSLGDPGAPTAVLLHGGGQTRHSWQGTAGVLADAGWRTVNVDLRGHGESDWSPDGVYDMDRFGADVARVAEQFDRPVLVGASLGGMSALLAIGETTTPIASALVLVDITTRPAPEGVERIRSFMRQGLEGFESIDDVADAVASYLPHRERPRDHEGLAKNLRRRDDGRWVWHWDPQFLGGITATDAGEASASFSQPERLDAAARRVSVPTLLIRGSESDIVSDDAVKHLHALIPHAGLVDVSGAGHMVAGDRNDRFTAAVLTFLDQLDR